MQEIPKEQNIAKVVLLSSLLTTVLIMLLLFLGREHITSYVAQNIRVSTQADVESGLVTQKEPVVLAVEKNNDSVVSVIVTKDVPVYERYYETFDPLGLFGGFSIPRVRENGTEEKEVGGGSGFVVTQDGLIVTNQHVVADATARYSVVLSDGMIYQVSVLARDVDLDIAILKIDEPLNSPLKVVTFGDSDSLELGQTVIAIGNALAEFQNSVSVGVISGLSRSIVATDGFGQTERLDQVIQTDAAINPGNSGGPLLNLNGEVIGVSVATSRGADNIAFAIPAAVVKQVVDSIQEYGEIVRPYIGVRYVANTPRLAEVNNLPVEYGVLVISGAGPGETAVAKGSPAEKIGLQEGDIIIAIDDEELRDIDLASVLRRKTVGETVPLKIIREGEYKTLSVTLERAL